jgi:hypothetical protein
MSLIPSAPFTPSRKPPSPRLRRAKGYGATGEPAQIDRNKFRKRHQIPNHPCASCLKNSVDLKIFGNFTLDFRDWIAEHKHHRRQKLNEKLYPEKTDPKMIQPNEELRLRMISGPCSTRLRTGSRSSAEPRAQDFSAKIEIFENIASEIPEKADEGKNVFAKRTNSLLR